MCASTDQSDVGIGQSGGAGGTCALGSRIRGVANQDRHDNSERTLINQDPHLATSRMIATTEPKMRHPGVVSAYKGAASLEWWANRWTNLSTVAVDARIEAVDVGWTARVTPCSAAERLDLALLPSPFTLRFPDGSAFDVYVAEPTEDGVFELREWGELVADQEPCPACQGSMERSGATESDDFLVQAAGDQNRREVDAIYTCSTCGARFVRRHLGAPWRSPASVGPPLARTKSWRRTTRPDRAPARDPESIRITFLK